MNRRPVLRLLGALLATAGGAAIAQGLPALVPEKHITQPVEPGAVAPWRPVGAVGTDPGETGSLAAAPTGRSLADWYAQQGSPVIALLLDRRLERLPADWDGTARLVIAGERNDEGRKSNAQVTIGVEHKRPSVAQADRRPLVKLLENAVLRELQRGRFKLVDPTLAERALAARGKPGEKPGDTEYLALKGAAGYLLEVELVPSGGGVALLGSLKHLGTGEIVASVRQPLEHDLAGNGADVLARAFVKRLSTQALPA